MMSQIAKGLIPCRFSIRCRLAEEMGFGHDLRAAGAEVELAS
jgi:hypothetical protein